MATKKEEETTVDFEIDPDLPYASAEDPPYRCGWHLDAKQGHRCGNDTTLILIGASVESGMFFIPICSGCAAEAVLNNSGTVAHRYGDAPSDFDT
jgi:hypothetical protein